MQVKNIWDCRLPFSFTYQGQQFVIPYGAVMEIPDGAVDPNGVRGYLICRETPKAQILPNLLEIDLSQIPIYYPEKYETEDVYEQRESYTEITVSQVYGHKESSEDNRRSESSDRTDQGEDDKGSSEDDRKESPECCDRISQEYNPEPPRTIYETIPKEVNLLEDLITPIVSEKPLKGAHLVNRGIKSRIGKKKDPSKASVSKGQSKKRIERKMKKESLTVEKEIIS